ncbi:MAG TPA: protein kinase [Coleofasciculaceae cyanobacterium]
MMQVTAGSTLQNGKYVLNQMLHQINLEVTFKATQVNLNQAVVVKTLQPNFQVPVDVAVMKPPFLEAVRRFAQCHHPHLVRILDGFKEKDHPFIVLEYIAGQTFGERVQSRGPFSEERAIAYVRQAGSALSLMHNKGLIHTNVNPSTLSRRPKTHTLLLDGIEFLALLNQANGFQEVSSKRAETDAYAALEQAQTSDLPPRPTVTTDVYGLAATLYYLVTGCAPLPVVERERGASLLTPRQLQPGLSIELETAILQGMQIHSQYRPPTMAAWLDLLPVQAGHLERVAVVAAVPSPEIARYPGAITAAPSPVASVSNNEPAPLSPSSNGQQAKAHLEGQSTMVVARAAEIPRSSKKSTLSNNPVANRRKQALVLTGAIAAVTGLGIGLALRFSGSSVSGTSLFHTEQSFPRYSNWPGEGDSATVPDTNEPVQAPEVVVPDVPTYKPPAIGAVVAPPSIAPLKLPNQPTPEVSPEPVAPPVVTTSDPPLPPVAAPRPAAPPPEINAPPPVELPPPPVSDPQPAAAPDSAPVNQPVAEPQL